jgi:hypothetical protein
VQNRDGRPEFRRYLEGGIASGGVAESGVRPAAKRLLARVDRAT